MNIRFIAGVDEVGRGPLAGDVVAAAVILPEKHDIKGLADSKKLSEKKREQLFVQIKECAVSWSIARANVKEIDQLNILQASLLAMKRSVEGLDTQPDFVQVDGNKLPDWHYAAETVVGGDALIEQISAASILAKVTRDREMVAFDHKFPEYGFARHKGYPTKAHMEALKQYGATEIHRKSFAPVKKILSDVG